MALSTPSLSIVTMRMTPPDEPSRHIARETAFLTNSWASCLLIPFRKLASQYP
eukprot:CAMPEP_0184312464 /NCGR_PEP_ID=MMETSP1049-20130417/50582_1 /TAXON_ID=77928 /ORGANISM="Proteomonas sulcata, Strain CCMP704" /LENGTH=52 /DNA_ID=CAMNT_0026628673 /DNA_START=88 /DNA_END=246 /DNA_ORIENTATION=+